MPISLSLTQECTDKLKALASEIGSEVSPLADLLLRFGLEKVKPEQLKKWVETRQRRAGRLGGALTNPEQLVLQRLRAAEPAWRLREQELSVGTTTRVVRAALTRLRARGLVQGWVANGPADPVDRWGHPVDSWWWLAERGGATDLRRLHTAVSWLRDRARDTYCPGGIERARYDLVTEFGLSVLAIGLPGERDLDHALGKREVSMPDFASRWNSFLRR